MSDENKSIYFFFFFFQEKFVLFSFGKTVVLHSASILVMAPKCLALEYKSSPSQVK